MDTTSPTAFVNGGLLHMHVGRKVRAVIQVTRSDVGFVMGKSADDRQLVVKGSPPVPLTSYVEVIGVAENDNSIRAEIWTNFGDSFGMSYSRLNLLDLFEPC
ncbi:replication protein A 14 kDa subunit B-like [Durio zibethinus]|uniref:Replication protein A 14 kDa subunit B-like n=1 Tax=Durio zibethinus TaxID=66656 RepID=A0A6P6AMR5_DURZI|nr:replication protein A 14 kDa subunit B-like [Durio zibethinus]